MTRSTRRYRSGDATEPAGEGGAGTPGGDAVCRKYDEMSRIIWQRDPASGAQVFFSYYEPARVEQPVEKPPKQDRLYDYRVSLYPPRNTGVTYPPGTGTITRYERDRNRRLISQQTVAWNLRDAWPWTAE